MTLPTMGRIEFGSLRDAWKGEARDFTPLLAERLDQLGEAIGVDLVTLGQAEVATAGGRSIDIVAQTSDGPELVIENQYGSADHDHLTRGLAYAVAREARGLVVVAERHRDEFRSVAQYLNRLAEHDDDGISVWLVEARAVRIDNSVWAPLFTVVESPNAFTTQVEQAKKREAALTVDQFLDACASPEIAEAAQKLVSTWTDRGYTLWRATTYISLVAPGPSKGGTRTVLSLLPNGQIAVPFSAYAGTNSGIPIESLCTEQFRAYADDLFGFEGTPSLARTPAAWLAPGRVDDVLQFATRVADAYAETLAAI
jgi:hypothetical protein